MTNETEKKNENVADNLCGYGKCTPKLLQIFSGPKSFTLVVCIISAAQGFLVTGMTSVNLRDLEKQFGFSSKESSFILISCDISGIILVPLVSFYGAKGHKPKWIGWGSVVIGIGVLLMILPKILVQYYHPTTASFISQTLCDSNNATTINKCFQSTRKSSGMYLAIFFLAQLIVGAGISPILTLGNAYIDENVDPKSSPIYLGFLYATTMIGPGLGFLVGGIFLSIYVDIKQPIGMTLTRWDPRWIGAWWLGYASFSWILFLCGIIMLAFPKEMMESRKSRLEAIKNGILPSTDSSITRDWRGMAKATIRLLSNKTYIFAVFAITCGTLFGSTLGAFFPKFIVTKFGETTSFGAITSGGVLFPSMTVGIIIGSIIMKKIDVKDSAKKAALMCTILGVIALAAVTIFLMPGCKDTNLAGARVPYYNSSNTSSLFSKCNTKCGKCSRSRYNPICGSDGITYFSPCFAGCKNKINNTKMYGNCSCIPILQGMNTRNATSGRCNRDCKNVGSFLALIALFAAVLFIRAIPHRMIILRSVPDNQRAYALGLQFLFLRLLAFTPGPIIMGAVFDAACSAWGYTSCGVRGTCFEFKEKVLSNGAITLSSICLALSLLCYILSWTLYKPINHGVIEVDPDQAVKDVTINPGAPSVYKISTQL